MGKFKWILLGLALLAVINVNAVAGEAPGSKVFLSSHVTSTHSAVLAAYAAVLTDGSDSAMSVSNTLGVPDLGGAAMMDSHGGEVDVMGFPEGGDREGAVWLFCNNTMDKQMYVFNSADYPGTGLGLNMDGTLSPGSTFQFFLSEALGAIGFPSEANFIGYCYAVGAFDGIAGTYVNFFETQEGQQAFPMQKDFTGTPITIMSGEGDQ